MNTFKKIDRVKVRAHTSRFVGEKGTVVGTSYWVFGDETDLCYLVALDSGTDVICDPEDLELTDENDE